MSQDWRQNPNLVECYENCVAMFRGRIGAPLPRPPREADRIKARRKALGLSANDLALMAGLHPKTIWFAENDRGSGTTVHRVVAALDRLEAERQSDSLPEDRKPMMVQG